MNKRTMILLVMIGALIVAFLATLLISRAGYTADIKNGTTTEAGKETAGIGSTENTTDTGGKGQTGHTGEAPAFVVDFGVGDQVDFGSEAPAKTDPTIQGSQSSASSRPTQDQDLDGTLDATDGENGMPDKLLTYEEFLALSNADQQAYFFCFDDPLDYAQWLRQAQQEHEEGKTSIVVTGPVELETLP